MTTFSDTSTNEDANRVSADFVRDRIREIVHDPAVAAKLTPNDHPIGSKRICLDTDYFATYNRENVTLVDVRADPIERVTTRGVIAGGTQHEVDTIVFATGYDAMTGPLNAIDITGLDGRLLREQWAAGPRTYLGIAAAGFPNLFLLTGPGSPAVLVNMFVSIEQHVDWVVDLLERARDEGIVRVQAQPRSVEAWGDEVNRRAARTLFVKADSWYLGANIPGKPRVFMPFVGGMGSYREICEDVARDGYRGFTLTSAAPAGSAHLLDPELTEAVGLIPPQAHDLATLPAMRRRLATLPPGRPDPATTFPGTTCTERMIPGLDGDPPVRVLQIAATGPRTAAPALVWMHGGGYVAGSATTEEPLGRQLAAELGLVVLSVDYRLAPETPAPGALHDCYAVLSWIHTHAEEFGVDPDRIGVGGSSAGGGLAAALAILARDRGEVPVRHQALVYPMLDDRTVTAQPHPFTGEFVWTPSNNRFGWTSQLGGEPGGADVSPYAAPARVADPTGLPAAFVAVGALDLFLDEDVTYAQRLLRAGVPTELHVYPGAFHGFDGVTRARVAQDHRRAFVRALDRNLNRPVGPDPLPGTS
jgi:acetyl esterase/lipase